MALGPGNSCPLRARRASLPRWSAGNAGDALVPAEQLARTQAIPGRHLEAVVTTLRRAGLVHSQRGPEGGCHLARPAAEISLADVINAIFPSPAPARNPRSAAWSTPSRASTDGADRQGAVRDAVTDALAPRREASGRMPVATRAAWGGNRCLS